MRLYRKLAAFIMALVLLGMVSCFAEEGETRILVIETTDIHGYIMDASSGNPAAFQYRMAYIARFISEARASGLYDGVLLLDGGDIYQGTPVSFLTGGAAMRAVMDRMEYDAIALGNHEFDWDVNEYAAESDGTIAPYVLGDYFGNAKTPILASNLYDAATGERVPFTKDYTIVEKGGKRIAVIGYIPDYSGSIMRERITPYTIDAGPAGLNALIRRVRETEQPDAVVVLAHEDPETVAAMLEPDTVSLVAGGHTHHFVACRAKNGIPCIQGGSNARGFATAVLVFGPDGVSAEDVQYVDLMGNRSLLLDSEENAAHLDPGIMELSRATWDAVSDEMSEVLGYITKPVVSRWNVLGASSGGNWITGLMLRATRAQGTVAAFYNTGGIRTSFLIPEGSEKRDITVYNVYTIAPFCNSLLVYEINGAEMEKLLIDGLKDPDYGDQMSGLTFTYSMTGDADTNRADREFTILSMTLSDGTVIDPADTQTLYRVCVCDYNATQPNSVFEGKEPLVPAAEAPVDNEAFIQVLREEGQAGGGYLEVDDGPRGVEAEAR